jgi:hypothetical protein
LLFDLSDRLKIGAAVKSIAANQEKLDEVICNVATSHIQTLDLIEEGESLHHWDAMRHTIACVKH